VCCFVCSRYPSSPSPPFFDLVNIFVYTVSPQSVQPFGYNSPICSTERQTNEPTIMYRDGREWLLAFPFPLIPMTNLILFHSRYIPKRSRGCQFPAGIPFPWTSLLRCYTVSNMDTSQSSTRCVHKNNYVKLSLNQRMCETVVLKALFNCMGLIWFFCFDVDYWKHEEPVWTAENWSIRCCLNFLLIFI